MKQISGARQYNTQSFFLEDVKTNWLASAVVQASLTNLAQWTFPAASSTNWRLCRTPKLACVCRSQDFTSPAPGQVGTARAQRQPPQHQCQALSHWTGFLLPLFTPLLWHSLFKKGSAWKMVGGGGVGWALFNTSPDLSQAPIFLLPSFVKSLWTWGNWSVHGYKAIQLDMQVLPLPSARRGGGGGRWKVAHDRITKKEEEKQSHALQVYPAQQINFKISVITSGIYYNYSKCFSPFKILKVSTSMGAQDHSRGGLGFTPSHNGVRNNFSSSKFCSAFKVCAICHLYVGKGPIFTCTASPTNIIAYIKVQCSPFKS